MQKLPEAETDTKKHYAYTRTLFYIHSSRPSLSVKSWRGFNFAFFAVTVITNTWRIRLHIFRLYEHSQLTFTCSRSAMQATKQGVKFV